MDLKILKIENPDWEEITTYYYAKKTKEIKEAMFIDEVSKLVNYAIDLDNFELVNESIFKDELDSFCKAIGVICSEILSEKYFEEDWSMNDTLIETKDCYIFRNWYTTA